MMNNVVKWLLTRLLPDVVLCAALAIRTSRLLAVAIKGFQTLKVIFMRRERSLAIKMLNRLQHMTGKLPSFPLLGRRSQLNNIMK